jgi:hypothetical protein
MGVEILPHQSIFELVGFQLETGWQMTTIFPGWGTLGQVQVIAMGIRSISKLVNYITFSNLLLKPRSNLNFYSSTFK